MAVVKQLFPNKVISECVVGLYIGAFITAFALLSSTYPIP